MVTQSQESFGSLGEDFRFARIIREVGEKVGVAAVGSVKITEFAETPAALVEKIGSIFFFDEVRLDKAEGFPGFFEIPGLVERFGFKKICHVKARVVWVFVGV